MALDRWLALGILGICMVYGYAAWFTMDDGLPRFMLRNPVWPSTFPKVLSVTGVIAALWVAVFQKPQGQDGEDDIQFRHLLSYNWVQALVLIGLMVAYAVTLRPLGFLGSTIGFLVIGATILGERRLWLTLLVSGIAGGIIWYLVSETLGIYLRPFPAFLT